MHALNAEPADPRDRKAHHLPPKSYADAAEEALHPNHQGRAQGHGLEYTTYVDEDSIKETPPNSRHERSERRSLSEPRPFGEVLDEQENSQHHEPATPTRMPRKPVPAPAPVPAPVPAHGMSYADAAHENLDDSHPKFNVAGDDVQELSGEGIDASPRSPIRRIHKRAPSKSLNGDGKEHHEQTPNKEAKLSHDHRQHNSPSEAHWLGQSKEHKASHHGSQDNNTESRASINEVQESPKGSQHQDQHQAQTNREQNREQNDTGSVSETAKGAASDVSEKVGNVASTVKEQAMHAVSNRNQNQDQNREQINPGSVSETAKGAASDVSEKLGNVASTVQERAVHAVSNRDQNQDQDTKGNKGMNNKSQSEGDQQVNEQGQGKIVYERFGNGHDTLTSVKPFDDFEKALRQDKIEESHNRKNEFASGKQAAAGWSTSAIRWAPLNVPLQRRLSTFMVLAHTLSIAGFLALFFLLCAIPLLWPILLPYLIYVLTSKAGTSGTLYWRNETIRRLPIWSLFASYFPARLHRSRELPPTRKYLFGYHPHGIISHGAFAAFATEALGFSQLFPGITNTLLTLDSNFRIPLYRDWALRLGMASVSRESCENILSRGGPNNEGMGRAITIVVGGARESLDSRPDHLRLVLKRRKGFVKLAIRTGADLVPVLAFGENELYDQFDPTAHPWIHKGQLMVKKVLGFTVPLFHARGVFNYDVGLMPYRRPMNIVVGRPVRVMQQAQPDQAYIDEIHEAYVKELVAVYDEWKDVFAQSRQGELEIVE